MGRGPQKWTQINQGQLGGSFEVNFRSLYFYLSSSVCHSREVSEELLLLLVGKRQTGRIPTQNRQGDHQCSPDLKNIRRLLAGNIPIQSTLALQKGNLHQKSKHHLPTFDLPLPVFQSHTLDEWQVLAEVLVQELEEAVLVGMDILELEQLPSSSNLLLACKRHTGSIPTPSRQGERQGNLGRTHTPLLERSLVQLVLSTLACLLEWR